MGEHAKISPSALPRLVSCPGSYRLIDALGAVSEDTAASISGSRKHALLSWRCNNPIAPDPSAIDDYLIGPDDSEAVDRIWPWVSSHPAFLSGDFHSEIKLEIGKWVGLDPGLMWGTADLVMLTGKGLEVVDAKFGNKLVAPDSWQLKAYAIGAGRLLVDSDTGNVKDKYRGVDAVTLTILQPSAPSIPMSQTYPLGMIGLWMNELKGHVAKMMSPTAPLVPGDEQCHFCPAKTACPARREQATKAAAGMFDVLAPAPLQPDPEPLQPEKEGDPEALIRTVEALVDTDPKRLTPEQLGKVLDLAPVVEAVIKDLRAEAERQAIEGRIEIPGWKVVEGRRGREWTVEDQAELIVRLRKLPLTAEEMYDKKVKTPAALETIVKGKSRAVVQKFGDLWRWKEGKPTLAPEGDPRPAIRTAESMFDKVPEPPAAPDTPAWW